MYNFAPLLTLIGDKLWIFDDLGITVLEKFTIQVTCVVFLISILLLVKPITSVNISVLTSINQLHCT